MGHGRSGFIGEALVVHARRFWMTAYSVADFRCFVRVHLHFAIIARGFLVFYIASLMIFTGRKLIKNVFGFLSAGMIFIYFTGILIDVSYVRYIGNALLLYFLFLIQNGEERKIEVFTVGFIPFYLLTVSFMFSNLA